MQVAATKTSAAVAPVLHKRSVEVVLVIFAAVQVNLADLVAATPYPVEIVHVAS